jgi:carboxypeptidase Taq
MTESTYQELTKIFSEYNVICRSKAVLGWDSAVNMPKQGIDARIKQLSYLSEKAHEILTSERVGKLLKEVDIASLDDWQKANVREIERLYKHNIAIPNSLMKKFSEAGSKCEHVWRDARKANDFKALLPHLKIIVDLTREIANLKAESFDCSAYDALLDQYDPGRKSADIDKVFAQLEEFLPEFIKQVVSKQSRERTREISGEFPIEKQKVLGNLLIEKLGFDLNAGRVDESHHPFCGGYKGDVRITSRYDEKDFTQGMMGLVHETGHALYEANLPEEYEDQPVGEAMGMSVHESQSLFYEMQIARSEEFAEFITPEINKAFDTKYRADDLYKYITKVRPSLIRVDADEVTYPMHIIMRYKIEKDLINGDMEVEELPEVWADMMDYFLGVEVKDDKDGCMQDIHWTDGSFGYFPTYSLGAMIAAQLKATIIKDVDDFDDMVEEGEFAEIGKWLSKNIHQYGSLYHTNDLVKKATGEKLDAKYYIAHLKKRYLEN